MGAFELLKYIYTSDRHGKYLDNVKHPARKKAESMEFTDDP